MEYRGAARTAAGRSLWAVYSHLPARSRSVLLRALPTRWKRALRSLVPAGVRSREKPLRPAPPLAVRMLVELWFLAIETRTRYERARRGGAASPERPRVYFFIRGAYGMGGTIRTVFTTADHLADQGYDVEVVSLLQTREKP